MRQPISPADVGIAIATFNRNDGLAELLQSLTQQQEVFGFTIAVVDNSPDGLARSITSVSRAKTEYIHEPRPGIVAARNAALASLMHKQAIIFVDDDEFVDGEWFYTLLSALNNYEADVAFGPVVSLLPSECPGWVRKGKYFDRRSHQTGDTVVVGATNNAIVRTETIRTLATPWFDAEFSVSGGSDTEFFGRVNTLGARLIWCNEAIVYERVPASRTTLPWIWKRTVRVGNVNGRLRLRTSGRITVALMGLARIALGIAKTILTLVTFRVPGSAQLGSLARGVGYIGAVLGKDSREYARD